jgi:hypothetical protein
MNCTISAWHEGIFEMKGIFAIAAICSMAFFSGPAFAGKGKVCVIAGKPVCVPNCMGCAGTSCGGECDLNLRDEGDDAQQASSPFIWRAGRPTPVSLTTK